MAKRTRYPNRTTARQAARRAERAEGAGSEARVQPRQPEFADASLGDASLEESSLATDTFDAAQVRATSSGLTDAEMRRAEELEAESTAREKAEIAESLRRRNRGAADDLAPVGDVNAPLSVRMSHEYDYVARDVRRIAITGGLMVAILAVLHILVNVMAVVSF